MIFLTFEWDIIKTEKRAFLSSTSTSSIRSKLFHFGIFNDLFLYFRCGWSNEFLFVFIFFSFSHLRGLITFIIISSNSIFIIRCTKYDNYFPFQIPCSMMTITKKKSESVHRIRQIPDHFIITELRFAKYSN